MEQQRRWALTGAPAIAVAVHPGIISTGLLRDAGTAAEVFFGWPLRFAQKTTAQGASTTVFAALAENVVAEVRSANVTFYANNAAASHSTQYTEAIGEEVWLRTEQVIASSSI